MNYPKVEMIDLSLEDKIFVPTDDQWEAIVSRDYLRAIKLGVTFEQYLHLISH